MHIGLSLGRFRRPKPAFLHMDDSGMGAGLHDTRTLVYFYFVARHGSYRLAARELSITVSALSRPIQRLERDLDTLLFIRGGRHETRLTEAGVRLLAYVQEVLAQLIELTEWAQHGRDGASRSPQASA